MNNKLRDVVLEGAVLLGALATVPLIILQERGNRSLWIQVGDWLVWCVFALEYAAGLAAAGDRKRFAAGRRLDLAVVVLSFPVLPDLMELARLARLLRLARFLRLVGVTGRAIHALGRILGRRGLAYMLGASAFLVFAAGGSLALLEPETAHGFWDGVWWAVVTVTTVGYGDITPLGAWGRIIAVLIMLTGLGLISTLSASIAAYFISEESGADLRSIAQQLDRIEKLLEPMARDRASKPG